MIPQPVLVPVETPAFDREDVAGKEAGPVFDRAFRRFAFTYPGVLIAEYILPAYRTAFLLCLIQHSDQTSVELAGTRFYHKSK